MKKESFIGIRFRAVIIGCLVSLCFVDGAAFGQGLVLRDQLGGSWEANDVDSYEQWAYYINQEGVAVIDFANPSLPQFRMFVDTPGTGYGLKVSYPHLFVAAGEAGLLILNISTPSAPYLLGSFVTAGPALRVDTSLNYAFVAMGESGVAVVNIDDPANPYFTGSYNTPGAALDLTLYGYNVFVADAEEGLRVINVFNPAAPYELGFLDTPGRATAIAHDGTTVYIADGEYGLHTIDISDPANPAMASSGSPSTGDEVDVSFRPGTSILATLNNQAGLRIINVSTLAQGWRPIPGEGASVKLTPSPLPYALVGAGDRGLRIVETETATEVGYYDNPGTSMKVDALGNYAFVADSFDGVMAVNVTDPSNIYPVAVYDTPGQVYDVKASGIDLYVADGDRGVKIINAYSPASDFSLLGEIETPGDANGIDLAENKLYVADGEQGLRIIDVSNPASPSELGSYNSPGDARGVAVQGGYAYLADGNRGLRVVDVTNSATPVSLGSLSTADFSFAVAVRGDYAFLADCLGGLRIIDARSPSAMEEVGRYANSSCARDVTLVGNFAYVAFSDGGLLVLDISDTRHPIMFHEQFVPSYSSANGVAVLNGRVYLAVEGDGLSVYEAVEPVDDSDADGVGDTQETLDGTDPHDAGSAHPVLETQLCSEWNGFLSMWNIMEHVNMSSGSLRVSSKIFSIDGTEGETRSFRVAAGAQQDLLVHDMLEHQENSYGKVCSTVSGGSPGDLDGRMVYYKAVDNGAGGYNFDFAFAMPFLNGISGSQFVPYNTYQPSLDPNDANNLVANWLQITNLSYSSQKGRLIFYDISGVAIQSRSVMLRAGARQDISGHDIVGIRKVGVVEWRPENIGVPFQLRNVRYYYKADGVSFDGAFQLEGVRGSGQELAVALDALNGSAILEISNVLPRRVVANIRIYDRLGVEVRQERRTLEAYQSYHLITDSYLATQGSGLATIQGNLRGSLVVTAMHYARNSSWGLNSIFGLQAEQALGTIMRGSYNTFLGQGCLLRLANPTSADVDVSLQLTRYDGTEVLGAGAGLIVGAKGMTDLDICGMDDANVYGVVRVQPATPNSIVANVIRIGPNEQYRFPTPVRGQ